MLHEDMPYFFSIIVSIRVYSALLIKDLESKEHTHAITI